MKQRLLILYVLFISNIAFATVAPFSTAIYYIGEQDTFLGTKEDCYVEADYSTDGTAVILRSLIFDEHDQVLVGAGPVNASYSANESGYTYTSPHADDFVLGLFLIGIQKKESETLELTLNDGHPHDYVCESLKQIEFSQLSSDIQDMFNHFEFDEHEEVAGDDHSKH